MLADDRPEWRPDHYRQALWGCEVRLNFPVVKLLHRASPQSHLEADANPFVLMTLRL